MNEELKKVLDALLDEKDHNDIKANESEFADFYLGCREGLSFAIDLIKTVINN